LELLLQHGQMAKSSFHYYQHRASLTDKYLDVKAAIKRIFHAHKGRLGYRRITELLKQSNLVINHKTVLNLMHKLGLKCLIRLKKYRSYKGEVGTVVANVLARDFNAQAPNQKWATDITEFKVAGKKLHLSPIIDLFNREIISFELTESPNYKHVAKLLDKTFKKHKQTSDLILHSDQGWHYQMKHYQKELANQNVTQSMSRKGNCLDNAVIENFFGILKSELYYTTKFQSIQQLKKEIKSYIKYYNHERIKMNLKGMSPVDYRAHYVKSIV
jgi:putative transposase